MILEDVYLLVVPSNQVNMDEEKRAQAAKAKRLYTGERMDESTGMNDISSTRTMSSKYGHRFTSVWRNMDIFYRGNNQQHSGHLEKYSHSLRGQVERTRGI